MLKPEIKVDAATELYGIFGNPARHSLSPFIHNTLFRELGINAVYLAFQIEENSLALAFEAIRALGMRGVNVTIPFKEKAENFVDEIPEDIDRGVGAINTVVNKKGRLFGFNTDGPGFIRALKEELAFTPEGKRIFLLGAGGAARGAAFAAAHAKADEIFIHNRTPGRAEGLAEYLAEHFPETEIRPISGFEELRGNKIDLVVNATSCGMKPDDPPPFDLKLLGHQACVYDLIYSPAETHLLKQAKNLGWVHANGLGMLANQAALSFALWTGRSEGIREAMRETLKKCHL